MSDKSVNYLFSDKTEVDTMKTIDSMRARLGARASLAQLAKALAEVARSADLEHGTPSDTAAIAASGIAPMQAVLAVYEVMDHLPIGVSVVDAGLQIRIFNRMARQLLDFPDDLFENGMPHFSQLILFNARRGEYGRVTTRR